MHGDKVTLGVGAGSRRRQVCKVQSAIVAIGIHPTYDTPNNVQVYKTHALVVPPCLTTPTEWVRTTKVNLGNTYSKAFKRNAATKAKMAAANSSFLRPRTPRQGPAPSPVRAHAHAHLHSATSAGHVGAFKC